MPERCWRPCWVVREHAEYKARRSRWVKRLLQNGVKRLIAETRAEALSLERTESVDKALHYFEENLDRMQYRTFRQKGYFIGSGVVEAGCKTIIGHRCKQSGMFWSRRGAENILALRCITSSHRLDLFWTARRDQPRRRHRFLRLRRMTEDFCPTPN